MRLVRVRGVGNKLKELSYKLRPDLYGSGRYII
jgi:hypothetical protein